MLDKVIDRALIEGWRQLMHPPLKPISVIKRIKRSYQSLQLQDEDWPLVYTSDMDRVERWFFENGPDVPSVGAAGCTLVLVGIVLLIALVGIARIL